LFWEALLPPHNGGEAIRPPKTGEEYMLHEKLESYRESIRSAEEISKECAKWPRGYAYLADQVKRAVASIVLNTAEGNSRRSEIERRRFFEIARASSAEVSACIDLMKAFSLTSIDKSASYKNRIISISKMLWGLMR